MTQNIQNWCHIHNHSSEGSLLDGFGKIEDYVKTAAEMGFTSIALSDHASIDGLIKFQNACDKYKITPIFAIEFYMVPDVTIHEKGEKRAHIVVFARNKNGWGNILKLITKSYLEGFYYKPRIQPSWLYEHIDGLLITTACSSSFLMFDWGEEVLKKLIELNKENVFLEVMPHQFPEQLQLNKLCLELSKKYGLKLVCSNDLHYVRKEDAICQEVLLAVQTKKLWSDPNRWKFQDAGSYYLKDKIDMASGFRKQGVLEWEDYNQALKNTLEVAEKCSEFTHIDKKRISLPVVPELAWEDDEKALKMLCLEGFAKLRVENRDLYQQRLDEELDLIIKKNFTRYFLIVWELVKWCKDNDIMTGWNRGSAGSSLVCYCLGITKIDPIKYNLLFARFISSDRKDFPDVDVDIEDVKRHLVREHIEKTYGKWNVVGLSTFSIMKGKSALRDVSRVFSVPLIDINIACNAIESKLKGEEGYENTIADAFENTEEGRRFAKKYPEVAEIAIKTEGTVRQRGVHASALIIANEDLRNGNRCALVLGKDKEPLINWDKDDAEYMGLMKMDLLGLSMLSILKEAQNLIKENHNIDIDFDKIPFTDKRVFREFSAGNNIGCFQVGSPGLMEYCKKLGIEDFNMLVNATALYRPGTLRNGESDVFIQRKRGDREVPKQHPLVDKITKDTYGILLFQESIMQLANEVAGLEWAITEKIRKVIAKSKGQEALREYADMFIQGCIKNKTLSEEEATELWEKIATCGDYLFNKCLTGDTLVYRGGGGKAGELEEITLKKIYDVWNSNTSTGHKYKRQGLMIRQLYEEDGRIRLGKIRSINYSGKQKVYKIITESGLSIKATKNHKFLCIKEQTINNKEDYKYIKVSNLKEGMYLFKMGEYEKTKYISTEVPRFRGEGTSYEGCGFQTGEKNIGYVDGRNKIFNETKKILTKRSLGICEKCGKQIYKFCKECGHLIKLGRPEFAHIKLLDELDYDYSKYHSPDNVLYLCNSCHKKFDYLKKERKKRHSKGRPAIKDKIISIQYSGIEDTYDIEMEEPNHNFIANGIVSHNSHAVGYTVITYFCMWLKIYYPVEFICALLTFGSENEDKKNEYIEEAFFLGIEVRPPKFGISDSYLWVIKNGILYTPFIEIKGIGDKTAVAFTESESIGFYKKDGKEKKISSKFMKILDEIRAKEDIPLDPEQVEKLKPYFKFSFEDKGRKRFKN